MKKQTKRLLSLLLSLIMVIGMLPATAGAEETPALKVDYTVKATCDADGTILGTFNGSSACVDSRGWLHICKANFPSTIMLHSVEHHNTDSTTFYDVADGFASPDGVKTVIGLEVGVLFEEWYKEWLEKPTANTMQGIQYFTSLKNLLYTGKPWSLFKGGVDRALCALDLSKNTQLESLYLYYPNMEHLDLSHNTKLKELEISHNYGNSTPVTPDPYKDFKRIQELDLTKLTDLEHLRIEDEDITTLDLSENTKLEYLYFRYNDEMIVQPEMPQDGALYLVDMRYNGFTEMHMGSQPNLHRMELVCQELTKLDVTKCPELFHLNVGSNSLTELDMTHNPKLNALKCSNNQLVSLDLSQNDDLDYLECGNNNMVALDLHGRNYISPSSISSQKITIERIVDDKLDLKTFHESFDLDQVVVKEQNGQTYQFFNWKNKLGTGGEYLTADENGILTLPNPNFNYIDYYYDTTGIGVLEDRPMGVQLEFKNRYYTITNMTEGVALPKFNYSNPLGDDVTKHPAKRDNSLRFIVEIEDGYTESVDGISVYYEMGDGERTEAASYDGDGQVYYVIYPTAPTKIYVTGVEKAAGPHEHQWTDWSDNKDGTHTRSCRCNATETKGCTWGKGVVTAPTCTEAGETTYTCGDCGAVKTEPGEAALNHDWTDWTDTGANAVADVHERSCQRDGCDAKGTGNHEWSNWASTGSTEHKKTCSVCTGERTAQHTFGDWAEIGGDFVGTCTAVACDATQTIKVNKPLDEVVVDNTKVEENAAGATLVVENSAQIFEDIVTLTNTEAAAVAGGATISVYLEVEDITDSIATAAPADAAKAEEKAEADNSKIGMYLDIDLNKKVGDNAPVAITETNNEVTITITVPDELINTDPNVTRTYKIVRVHDGWAEIIYGDFDPATKTLTFKTSKFSTYALAYADTSTPVYDPYIPAPATYPVSTAPADNGTVKVNYTNVVAGATVTITVEPKTGYTLETLTVLDQLGRQIPVTNVGGGKYTFRMPAGGVTVVPTFMEDNTMLNFFVDVKAGDYYYDAVLWAAINGITKGDTAVTFAPDKACTRAQMVTFLWRAAGCPEPTGTAKGFADVTADSYYSKAVLWAVEQGITNGTGDTTFSPDATCTRAQMAAFLCRLAGGKAVGTAAGFTDVKSDAYYAEAVRWAAENGITNGTGDGTTFSPDATCTRGQMVTFLYRYFAN